MNKRVRSQGSLRSAKSSSQTLTTKEEIYIPPLDVLTVKIQSLRITNEDFRRHAIKVTFFDQLLISTTIMPIRARAQIEEQTIACGTLNYDPSDYEKMCLFADNPLVVRVQPIRMFDSSSNSGSFIPVEASKISTDRSNSLKSEEQSSTISSTIDISCCNIDILPLFKDVDKKRVRKRMQPLIDPMTLQCHSWENLPLITIELEVTRNPLNEDHHKIFKKANFMKITLVAAYNVLVPYDQEYTYTAATKSPLSNENNPNILTFNQGYRYPRKFNSTHFYPNWETLIIADETFSKGDKKLAYDINNVQNDDNIDLDYYMTASSALKTHYSVVWGSFHRHLILMDGDRQLWKHLRQFQWPIECHIYGKTGGYSFMGFMDLFRLLYPGETTVQLAVPLQWVNAELMMEKCGCDMLLTANEKEPDLPFGVGSTPKPKLFRSPSPESARPSGSETPGRALSDEGLRNSPKQLSKHSFGFLYASYLPVYRGTGSTPTSESTEAASLLRPSGSDGNCAFVVVEVQLFRPLIKPSIPPVIEQTEIKQMLIDMEDWVVKPKCTGRGQPAKDWHATVHSAAKSLRRVPYYGMTEFCAFNRQLSETRTRVELTTSCWLDAAVYVNNNFVVQEYLQSDDTFEEMIMMAHACLLKETGLLLIGAENVEQNPTLRAARQARQLQDPHHAMELHLQFVAEGCNDANRWRELSTCMRDIDSDLADVCIDRAIMLDPRHPLTLLAKGSILYKEDIDAAELFFTALLSFYPLWTTGWVIASAFYIEREEFHMADQIMEYLRKTLAEGSAHDMAPTRSWERELGDWWDHTPLLPGMSRYLDAADLLLRLRAMSLAEVCLGRALSEGGESAAYKHLVALSCHLRGDTDNALCHLEVALESFGEISYLRSLQAECFHRLGDRAASLASFEKSGNYANAYSILTSLPCRDAQRTRSVLVDLLRRLPSARAWMALADDWIMRQEQASTGGEAGDGAAEAEVGMLACAVACAVQALRWDRQCARAWALLARLVRPRARREHCRDMAAACGYEWTPQQLDSLAASRQSLCFEVGKALKECNCDLCEFNKF